MNSFNLLVLVDHLWESTLFAVIAGCFALLLRKKSARVRYWIWLAASAKFLVPFALLSGVGAQIARAFGHTQLSFLWSAGRMAAQISNFGAQGVTAVMPTADAAHPGDAVLLALGTLWLLGFLAVVARRLARWAIIRRALRESKETSLTFVVPVRSSSSGLEPGVVGILRPVLLIPEGIEQRLTPDEMRAVLAHEQCHVACADNLAAAAHMLVEALFWFHPLIWWLGKRLVDERERACDDYVLATGHARVSYAEGILKVCEHYLESRLPCVAGVSGANLRQRIETIMHHSQGEGLSGRWKLAIAAAAVATIVIPVLAGALEIGAIGFRNVSIQLTPPERRGLVRITVGFPQGKLNDQNMSPRALIARAYGVPEFQVVGRDWGKEPTYDLTADAPTDTFDAQIWHAVSQDLLAKHFGLVVKEERKQMDGYVLLIGSGGSKLKPGAVRDAIVPARINFALAPPSVALANLPIDGLADFLSNALGAPVVDQTGLHGNFEYSVSWQVPSMHAPPEPAVVTKALQDQLGLHLERSIVTAKVINVVALKSAEEAITKRVAAR